MHKFRISTITNIYQEKMFSEVYNHRLLYFSVFDVGIYKTSFVHIYLKFIKINVQIIKQIAEKRQNSLKAGLNWAKFSLSCGYDLTEFDQSLLRFKTVYGFTYMTNLLFSEGHLARRWLEILTIIPAKPKWAGFGTELIDNAIRRQTRKDSRKFSNFYLY